MGGGGGTPSYRNEFSAIGYGGWFPCSSESKLIASRGVGGYDGSTPCIYGGGSGAHGGGGGGPRRSLWQSIWRLVSNINCSVLLI